MLPSWKARIAERLPAVSRHFAHTAMRAPITDQRSARGSHGSTRRPSRDVAVVPWHQPRSTSIRALSRRSRAKALVAELVLLVSFASFTATANAERSHGLGRFSTRPRARLYRSIYAEPFRLLAVCLRVGIAPATFNRSLAVFSRLAGHDDAPSTGP